MAILDLKDGLVAIVDDYVYDEVARYKWRTQPGGRTFNAVRTTEDGRIETMQRFVMNHAEVRIPDKRRIRHINGNGLDNRMENLRVRTT